MGHEFWEAMSTMLPVALLLFVVANVVLDGNGP